MLGTYLHGLFDDGALADALVRRARAIRGLPEADAPAVDFAAYREAQFDKLADVVRASLDMDAVYRILKNEE